jgi:hypothetical protein
VPFGKKFDYFLGISQFRDSRCFYKIWIYVILEFSNSNVINKRFSYMHIMPLWNIKIVRFSSERIYIPKIYKWTEVLKKIKRNNWSGFLEVFNVRVRRITVCARKVQEEFVCPKKIHSSYKCINFIIIAIYAMSNCIFLFSQHQLLLIRKNSCFFSFANSILSALWKWKEEGPTQK